jgi:hypothetical protein
MEVGVVEFTKGRWENLWRVGRCGRENYRSFPHWDPHLPTLLENCIRVADDHLPNLFSRSAYLGRSIPSAETKSLQSGICEWPH